MKVGDLVIYKSSGGSPDKPEIGIVVSKASSETTIDVLWHNGSLSRAMVENLKIIANAVDNPPTA